MPEAISPLVAGSALTIILALLGMIWRRNENTTNKQWEAIEKRATAEALREAREHMTRALQEQRTDHLERLREMKDAHQQQMSEMAARQDREVDTLKASIDELRRDVTQGHINIMKELQALALMMRQPANARTGT